MDFFPEPPSLSDDEVQEYPQPVWANPPEDVLAGVVPVELILGQSESTVVLLAGVRAFPTGLQMSLGVRVRGPVGRREPQRGGVRRPVQPHPGLRVAGRAAEVGFRARGRSAGHQRRPVSLARAAQPGPQPAAPA